MLPLATCCHADYHLHPVHFTLSKFKYLVAKQHQTRQNTRHSQTSPIFAKDITVGLPQYIVTLWIRDLFLSVQLAMWGQGWRGTAMKVGKKVVGCFAAWMNWRKKKSRVLDKADGSNSESTSQSTNLAPSFHVFFSFLDYNTQKRRWLENESYQSHMY